MFEANDSPSRFRPRALTAVMLVFAGVAATALTACGGGSSGSASSVTKEQVAGASGSIHVLGWQFYQDDKVQNAGPVKADWSYLDVDSDVVTKSRPGYVDVTNPSGTNITALNALDVVQPINTELLSNYRQLDPAIRNSPTWKNDAGQVVAVPSMLAPQVTAYNTNEVPMANTLNDLLKPVYRGKIGMFDDPTEIAFIASAQGVTDTTKMTHAELDRAMAFLDQLRPNIKTFWSIGQDTQLFNSDDVAVTFSSFGSELAKAIANNPAIKFNFVGQQTFVDTWSILNDANAPAAYSWINRAISLAGQEALVRTSGGYPANPAALPALKAAGDPVSTAEAKLSISQILKAAPLSEGFAVSNDGKDIVTRDEAARAWSDYKSSF